MVKIYYDDKFMDGKDDITVCVSSVNLGLDDINGSIVQLCSTLGADIGKGVGLAKKNPSDEADKHIGKSIAKSRAHSIVLANAITQLEKAEHDAAILSKKISEAKERLTKEQLKSQCELHDAKNLPVAAGTHPAE